ncbi:MAG TPA: LamG-like jellyroll fold domain-containing protein, partial [Anaerolineae bacterium]|nr:LamG-like jellyroll fold domain-containing protein [Anaerolineae bacterium]
MNKLQPTIRFFIIPTILLLILLINLYPTPSASASPLSPLKQSPSQTVHNAWRLAQQSPQYNYHVHLNQTTYPAPALTSAGQQPTTDIITLQGAINQKTQEMEMTLWQTAVPDPNQALHMRIIDGQAYGRAGTNQTWEPINNDISQLFAPNGDTLAFLAGATNIHQLPPETRDFSHPTNNNQPLIQTFTPYRFDINGPTYATHARQQLEKVMAERGQLPKGIQLQNMDIFQTMSGHGTLWLDDHGLPFRLQTNLTLHPDTGETLTIEITTDYANFDTTITQQSSLTTTLKSFFPTPTHARQNLALQLTLFALFLALLLASTPYWYTHRFRQLISATIALSILLAPLGQLIDAAQIDAFYSRAEAANAKQDADDAQRQTQENIEKAFHETNWNPNQSPLTAPTTPTDQPPWKITDNAPLPIRNDYLATQIEAKIPNHTPTSLLSTADTDGDGLLDVDEIAVGSCAGFAVTPDFCTNTIDPTDTDGDGLGDALEVKTLNTLPMAWDSDNDTISDTLEVNGFTYAGQQWYLNPNEPDSNKDGLNDGIECPQWSPTSGQFNPALPCQDTDGDNIPDAFDNDNDNDGLSDEADISPFTYDTTLFNDTNPMNLTINDLQTDKPVFVNLQITPNNPDHLNYIGSILDWPSPDYRGQVQRGLNTTFATAQDPALRSTAPNAANGDIRVVPMLEITIPFSDTTHFGNLPIKTGTTPTDNSNLSSWLGTEHLNPYNIRVNQRDGNNVNQGWVSYIPLSPVTEYQGGSQVGFAAQMLYWPSVDDGGGLSSWGPAHQYRVVWLVQMLTDRCVDPKGDPETCQRVEELSVIHQYAEEWRLTGMEIREDHGIDVAIMYENPALDTNRQSDDYLWAASWSLGTTFMRGRDCETLINNGADCIGDGARDVTLANITTQVSSWFTAPHPLVIDNSYSYAHHGYAAHIMMTDTLNILNTHFNAYSDSINPTFLFAREDVSRRLNLNDLTSIGGAPTFSFAGIPTVTSASLSWAPYDHKNGSWQNHDLRNYLNNLQVYWENNDLFGSDLTQDEQDGYILWSQMYYSQLFNGLTGIVEQGATPVFTKDIRVPEINHQPKLPPQTFFGAGFAGATFFLAIVSYSPALAPLAGVDNLKNSFYSRWLQSYRSFGIGAGSAYASQNPAESSKIAKVMKTTRFGLASNAFVAGLTAITLFLALSYAIANIGLQTPAANEFQTFSDVVIYSLNIISAIMAAIMILTFISILDGMRLAGELAGGLFRLGKSNRPFIHSPVSLLLGLVITWGFFLWELYMTGGFSNTTSITFNAGLARAVAASIVMIIFFILDYSIIGSILIALITLIDVLLLLIPGVNFSITGWLTEELAKLMYEVNLVPTNLGDSNRLDFRTTNISLVNDRLGFSFGNGFYQTVVITNSLTYDPNKHSESDLRRSTFLYTVDRYNRANHYYLGLDGMNSQWQTVNGNTIRQNQTIPPNAIIPFHRVGKNVSFGDRLYLNEAFAIPYIGCWRVWQGPLVSLIRTGNTNDSFHEYNCSTETLKNSQHIDIGRYQYFDIFPATFTEFMALYPTNGAAYNNFLNAPLRDADNDGLPNADAGGADPNDSLWDTDGDGLSDYFEISNQLDPTNPDTDGDGLTDREELKLLTNPLVADTDGDGLTDYFEVKEGWLITTPGGGLLRVWSHPRAIDIDFDGLSDREEYTLALHPEIPVDPSVLDNIIQINDFAISEDQAARALYHFDEPANATRFIDSSGNNRIGNCGTAYACPQSGLPGKYGNAIDLTRINTYEGVSTYHRYSPFATGFTIAAWIKAPSGPNAGGYIVNGLPFMNLHPDGKLEVWFSDWTGGAYYYTPPGVVPFDQWTHVAVSFDLEVGRVYVDGVEVAALTPAAPYKPRSITGIGFGFIGMIDEFAAYDYGMSPTEIDDLMNGRYNQQDLIVNQNKTLSYVASVTNTHPLRDASGTMVNATGYLTPSIPAAATAYSFSPTDLSQHFPDKYSSSTYISCSPTNNTCPATYPAGAIGQALAFDGLDNQLTLNPVGAMPETSLSFWLNLPAIPPAGQSMAVWSSEDNANNNFHISVRDNGALALTIEGTNILTRTVGGTPTCCVNTDTHLTNFSFAGNLNQWVHFVTNISTTTVEIFVDTTLDSTSVMNGIAPNLNIATIQVGQPTTASPATLPLTGRLDELILYRDYQLCDSCAINNILQVNGGFYTMPSPTTPGFYRAHPTYALEFETYELHYQNRSDNLSFATCDQASCPDLTSSGYFGSGLTFAAYDALNLGNLSFFGRNSYTIAGWFQTNGNLVDQRLLNATETNGSGRVSIDISRFGSISYYHGQLGGTANTASINTGTGYNNNQWHHVAAVFDNGTMRLYVDGNLIQSTTTFPSTTSTSLNVTLGSNSTAPFFTGQLDNWVLWPAALTTEDIVHLTAGIFPAPEITTPLIPFDLAPTTQMIITGQVVIADQVANSHHWVQPTIDVALVDPNPDTIPAFDPVSTANLKIHAPFEEIPSRTLFENIIGSAEFVCENSATCPTAGVPGRDNRAIYFDGVDDKLTPSANLNDTLATFSTWIKASRGTIFDSRTRYHDYGWHIRLDGITATPSSDFSCSIPTSSINWNLPQNSWSHLVVTVNWTNRQMDAYINGSLVGSTTLSYVTDCNYPNQMRDFRIGYNSRDVSFLKGFLDDVRMYNSYFTAAQVQTLYRQSVPRMYFSFDEYDTATSFVDSSENQYVGLPYAIPIAGTNEAVLSPQPGTDGKIGNTAFFDGNGYIQINDATDLENPQNNFTLLSWIKPDDYSNYPRLLSHGMTSSYNGLQWGIWNDGRLFLFNTNINEIFFSTTPVQTDYWQQVAVVFDSNNDATFYINGQLINTVPGNNTIVPNYDDPLYIGMLMLDGAPVNQYHGEMDELLFYARSLSTAELYNIYRRDLVWYRDRARVTFRIDSTPPTVTWVNPFAVTDADYTMLQLAAWDDITDIGVTELAVKGPGDADFVWQPMPQCLDSNNIWCPTLDLTSANTNDLYQFKFRAIDHTGNEQFSPVYSFIVDASPPIITSNYNNDWATPILSGTLNWQLPLNGSVTDSTTAVLTNSVNVTLYDAANQIAGTGTQNATVTGNSWSTTYEFAGLKPTGIYYIEATAEDIMGNAITTTVGTLRFDTRAPGITINPTTLTTVTIGSPRTISGTIADYPAFVGADLRFRFENPYQLTVPYFFDDSGHYRFASCINPRCPTTTNSKVGSGVTFDGVDDYLFVDRVDYLPTNDEQFTYAAWVKPNSMGNYGIIGYGNLNGTVNNLYLTPTGLGHRYGTHSWHLPTPDLSNQWHHIAVTFDGTQRTFYLDGVPLGTTTAGSGVTIPTRLHLGAINGNGAPPIYFFNGQLDEINILPRALNFYEIQALAQERVAGVASMEIAITPMSITTPTWQTVPLAQTAVTNTLWSFTIPAGLPEDAYRIEGRSTDMFGNISASQPLWAGYIDVITPTLTTTADVITIGDEIFTDYTFSTSDYALHEDAFHHPCAANELTRTMTGNRLTTVTASCRLPGVPISQTITTCDYVGHCPSQTHFFSPRHDTTTTVTLKNPVIYTGQNALYTIQYQNNGDEAATGLFITHTLSHPFILNNTQATVPLTTNQAGNQLSWQLPDMPANSTETITLSLQLSRATNGYITATTDIRSIFDADIYNNRFTSPTYIVQDGLIITNTPGVATEWTYVDHDGAPTQFTLGTNSIPDPLVFAYIRRTDVPTGTPNLTLQGGIGGTNMGFLDEHFNIKIWRNKTEQNSYVFNNPISVLFGYTNPEAYTLLENSLRFAHSTNGTVWTDGVYHSGCSGSTSWVHPWENRGLAYLCSISNNRQYSIAGLIGDDAWPVTNLNFAPLYTTTTPLITGTAFDPGPITGTITTLELDLNTTSASYPLTLGPPDAKGIYTINDTVTWPTIDQSNHQVRTFSIDALSNQGYSAWTPIVIDTLSPRINFSTLITTTTTDNMNALRLAGNVVDNAGITSFFATITPPSGAAYTQTLTTPNFDLQPGFTQYGLYTVTLTARDGNKLITTYTSNLIIEALCGEPTTNRCISLAPSLSSSPAPDTAPLTLTITLANDALDALTNATVTTTLPAGLALTGTVTINPPSAGTPTLDPNALVTNLNLPAQSQATLTLVVIPNIGANNTLTMTMTVNEAGIENGRSAQPIPINILANRCYANLNGTQFNTFNGLALQQAIDAATAGDTIKLAGTCLGTSTSNDPINTNNANLITLNKNITLQGGHTPTDWTLPPDPALPTILDANGVGIVINNTASDAALNALTLQNGYHGIYNTGGLVITNTLIQNNTTQASTVRGGGGIYNVGNLTLLSSSVINNHANLVVNDPYGFAGGGGYLGMPGSIGRIDNVTFYGNHVTGNPLYGGGAIMLPFNSNTQLHISNSTIVSNTVGPFVGSPTGGMYTFATTGGQLGQNLVFADNQGTACDGNGIYVYGDLIFHTDDGSCYATSTGDPLLGPLQDNGGFTPTILPLAGSPLISGANPNHCPTTDQRGLDRSLYGACDLGATEFDTVNATISQQLIYPPFTSYIVHGRRYTFSLTINNPNPTMAQSLIITHELQTTAILTDLLFTSSGDWTPQQNGNILTWSIGNLPAGQQATVNVSAIINSPDNSLNSIVTLDGPNMFAPATNTQSHTIYGLPDIKMSIHQQPSLAAVGDTIIYTLYYTNTGTRHADFGTISGYNGALENVVITAADISVTDYSGYNAEWGAYEFNIGFDNVPVGASGIITITGILSDSLPYPGPPADDPYTVTDYTQTFNIIGFNSSIFYYNYYNYDTVLNLLTSCAFNFNATLVNPDVDLHWTAQPGHVSNYQLYKSDTPYTPISPSTALGPPLNNLTTSFTDVNALNNTLPA